MVCWGFYVKGNSEIHSSDAGSYSDRYSDYPRLDKLFRGGVKKKKYG